jgi:hypothetical protein
MAIDQDQNLPERQDAQPHHPGAPTPTTNPPPEHDDGSPRPRSAVSALSGSFNRSGPTARGGDMHHPAQGGFARPFLTNPVDTTSLMRGGMQRTREEREQTEAMTVSIETEFALYMAEVTKVDFEPAKIDNPNEAESARNQVMSYLRRLREFTLLQNEQHLKTSLEERDPFFPHSQVPQLTPVIATDFETAHTVELSDYIRRMISYYPNCRTMPHYGPSGFSSEEQELMMGVLGGIFKVAISAQGSDASHHFLVMPEPRFIPTLMRETIEKLRQPFPGARLRTDAPR